jgi:ATP-dependent helicase/nuclease subunit A
METLLRLAQEFARKIFRPQTRRRRFGFSRSRTIRPETALEFETGSRPPSPEFWRKKLRFVFVDEYQDINAAQDRIIAALAREGAEANRFLVGDVKQSIYRFRLADPKIFRDYAKNWRGETGQTIPLSENFRSRESLA